MIRQPDRTATRSWHWDIDSSTRAKFRVTLSRGEYSHDGKCEIAVDDIELVHVGIQLDYPSGPDNFIFIDANEMCSLARERLELHGRRAMEESGWLDELIW